jgi:hypothetical protein
MKSLIPQIPPKTHPKTRDVCNCYHQILGRIYRETELLAILRDSTDIVLREFFSEVGSRSATSGVINQETWLGWHHISGILGILKILIHIIVEKHKPIISEYSFCSKVQYSIWNPKQGMPWVKYIQELWILLGFAFSSSHWHLTTERPSKNTGTVEYPMDGLGSNQAFGRLSLPRSGKSGGYGQHRGF